MGNGCDAQGGEDVLICVALTLFGTCLTLEAYKHDTVYYDEWKPTAYFGAVLACVGLGLVVLKYMGVL